MWTTDQVGEFLGYQPETARRSVANWARRMGVEAAYRQPGRGGQNVFRAETVRRKAAEMPGSGTRTDLVP
jgi:hypothetical protein